MTQTVHAAWRDVDRAPTGSARGGWVGSGACPSRRAVALLAPDVPIGSPADARDRMVVCGRICA
ncbi:hypothetical protein ACQUSR_33025 [Streptomyces sp. P1-3]|uniref:hypothetical protein n=1 Tax=Streptomyces sp. P1-3 TaxID=3421658 RepID=UPI003D365814